MRTRMLGGVGGAPEQSGPLSRSRLNEDAEEMAGARSATTLDVNPAISGDERVPLVPASNECNVARALVFGVR